MLPLLLLTYSSVSFGLVVNFTDTTENISDPHIALKAFIPKNETLNSLEDSIMKFIQNIEGMIQEIQENSALFLDNLEHEKANQLLQLFDSAPCLGMHEYSHLKKAFRIELGLLEMPVRETIVELKDKFTGIKISQDLERSLSEVKIISCQLINTTTHCTQIRSDSLCLNDSCSPSQTIMVVHNTSTMQLNNSRVNVEAEPKAVRNLLPTECSDGRYRCTSGQCISFHYACDGGYDCNDRTDELTSCSRSCSGKRCRNLNCITEDEICNGVDDCGDGTDESNCIEHHEGNCSLTSGNFLCSSKIQCLPLSVLCNGKNDCQDGSDEGGSCSNTTECMSCASAGGACVRTPSGPLCLWKCPVNFLFDLSTGICTNALNYSGPVTIYKSMSLVGIADKLLLLSKRFLNGYNILKKRMYQSMEKAVHNLNKCMEKNNPFIVV